MNVFVRTVAVVALVAAVGSSSALGADVSLVAFDRLQARMQSASERFEARAQRVTDLAAARINALEQAEADPNRVFDIIDDTAARLDALALALEAELEKIDLASQGALTRSAKRSAQTRAFPAVEIDRLRRQSERRVERLVVEAELTLVRLREELEDAVQ